MGHLIVMGGQHVLRKPPAISGAGAAGYKKRPFPTGLTLDSVTRTPYNEPTMAKSSFTTSTLGGLTAIIIGVLCAFFYVQLWGAFLIAFGVFLLLGRSKIGYVLLLVAVVLAAIAIFL